ncbi:hypothetical protein G7046_g492 [Stylonectria norvegica]|nr:hypothetical protein G7046_g492 [Stylonectria norvegica]
MAERWTAAAPYRDIFEALTSKTMSMVTDAGQQYLDKQGSTGVALYTQGDDQDLASGLSQWLMNVSNVEMSGAMETFFSSFMTNGETV